VVSLHEALVRAHEFQEVQHELPTVEFGLYRLLVALAGDIFFVEPDEPLNTPRLGRVLAQGRFDEARIAAYFERYANRFDLFHETCPFLQIGGLQDKEKPIANLLHPLPSGTNVTHFHHALENNLAVSPEAAFGLLTTIAPWMTAGGAGLSPSINGAPPVYALVKGNNLFETSVLNLCAMPLQYASDEDRPAWRWTREVGGERAEAGYLESLTWMPRRIRLTPGEGGLCTLTGRDSAILVRTMKFVAGDSTRFAWQDPNAAYRLSDKGATILRMREGRALWRDTAPLALLKEKDQVAERPRVVDQFADLVESSVIGQGTPLRLELYGLRTDLKMKVFEWQCERLTLPVPLVMDTSSEAGFGLEVQDWMSQANSVAYELRQAVKHLYPRGGQGNKRAFETRIAYIERRYWESLRPTFNDLLDGLAHLEANTAMHRQPLRAAWRKAVEKAARSVFELATTDLDANAHALERLTRARRSLEFGLKRVFDPTPPGKGKRTSGRKGKSVLKGADAA
jgi:CRISPR system Cascade subunit CasA